MRAGDRWFHPDVEASVRDAILAAVRRLHREHPLRPSLSLELARAAAPPRTPPVLAEHAVQAMVTDGTLVLRDDGVALAGAEATPSPEQERALERFVAILRDGGLAPPTWQDLPADLRDRADADDLAGHLVRTGQAVRVAPDLFVDAAAAREAVAAVRERLGGRAGLSPADFRAAVGDLTRKYLMPLLAWLDATGVTVRQGDGRSVPLPEEASHGT